MVLAAPHHEAAADAHRVVLDIDHACLAPRLEDSVHRPPLVEVLDVGAQKPARPPPGNATQRITRGRHHEAGIDAPARAPQRARRHEEDDTGHTKGGTKYASENGGGR